MCWQAGLRIYLVGKARCRGSEDSTSHLHPASDGGTVAANRDTDRHEISRNAITSLLSATSTTFHTTSAWICN